MAMIGPIYRDEDKDDGPDERPPRRRRGNRFEQDAHNLAQATMCLVRATKRMFRAMSNIDMELARDVDNSLDYAESEAKNILAKTEGA